MLRWFQLKCPLPTFEKTWTEWRLRWLAGEFGLERLLRAPVVLPNSDLLPDPWTGSPDQVRQLMDRLCRILPIDSRQIEIRIRADEQMARGTGRYHQTESGAVITLAASRVASASAAAAALAHDLSHHILLGRGRLEPDVPDHGWVTDLLPLYFGLGVFTTNAVLEEETYRDGDFSWWTLRRQGYLPAHVLGYAWALWAWIRGETNPPWLRALRLDAATAVREGLQYLVRTNDSLIHPQMLRSVSAIPDLPALRAQLDSRSPTLRLAALWDLGIAQADVTDLVPRLSELLFDKDRAVRAAAADALALASDAAQPAVPALVAALADSAPEVRARSAIALGNLQLSLDQVVPRLCALLTDHDKSVVLSAAQALAAVAYDLELPARPVLAALAKAVRDCNFDVLDALSAAAGRIPDLEAQIEDFFPGWDSEMRVAVWQAVTGEVRMIDPDR